MKTLNFALAALAIVGSWHVADHARTFDVGPVPDGIRLVHREQHAAMHRLQSVANIGKRAPDDDAHRVIEIRAPHLLFEAGKQCFLGDLFHVFRKWQKVPPKRLKF